MDRSLGYPFLDLSCEATAKRLGIDIDYQLNFDVHILVKFVGRHLSNSTF
jgi:hypothetical protein